MKLTLLISLSIVYISGCVIAPGNRMSYEPADVPGVYIQEINVEYIKSLADELYESKTETNAHERELLAITRYKSLKYQEEYQYRVGPRDILNVTVWDHPELTIPAGSFRSPEQEGRVIAEDGTMFYPYAGVIKVQGKTVIEIRDILTEKLSGKIKDPQVDVRVSGYRSQKAYIVGQVEGAGPLPITDEPLTVVRAIDLAGDVTDDADKVNVLLSRNGKYYKINLQRMYEKGDLTQNYLLQDGDILYIPDRSMQQIFVMGEVVRPQPIFMNNGRMTLSEALGRVGGADQVTSNPGRLYVIRGTPDMPSIFHLDAKSPGQLLLANAFPLEPFDVVFVGAAGVTRWNRVISQILPTATVLSTTALRAAGL